MATTACAAVRSSSSAFIATAHASRDTKPAGSNDALSCLRARDAEAAVGGVGRLREGDLGREGTLWLVGPEGLVDTARRSRRGFLLQPEWTDGDALGATVPTKTTEPLTGPGRGVWCDGGTAWVAQLINASSAEHGRQEMS